MRTSRFRSVFFVLLMLSALVVSVLVIAPQKALVQTLVQKSQPNIVFVLVDDMDAATINVAPEKYAPHIKSLLLDKGVTFPNFFVNVSLCCPSRTSILRGQNAHNTGVLTNALPDGGFEKAYAQGLEKETVATSLQANGYKTVLIGKYLNGYPHTAPNDTYIPPGWTEWYSPMEYDSKKFGDPYSQFNYTLNENGLLVKYGNNAEDYGTDVYTGIALDFIQRSAKEGKPFFVYLAPFNIHSPYTPAPRYANLFPNAKAPRVPNFNEADVSTKPEYIQDLLQLDQTQIDAIDQSYRLRLQSLQSVDEAIVKLVDTLKANGQLDNTYIVLSADNGYKQGIHRASLGKETAYEEDIRLTLVVRGPGISADTTRPQQVGNIDFFPTFTAMAGVKPPAFVDGRSFLQLLEATAPKSSEWRHAFLVEHKNDLAPTAHDEQLPLPQRAQVPNIPTYQAMRTGNYTYVEYETGEKELYNINLDRYQLHNLASTAAPALLQQFAARLSELRTCKADSCRAIEARPFTP